MLIELDKESSSKFLAGFYEICKIFNTAGKHFAYFRGRDIISIDGMSACSGNFMADLVLKFNPAGYSNQCDNSNDKWANGFLKSVNYFLHGFNMVVQVEGFYEMYNSMKKNKMLKNLQAVSFIIDDTTGSIVGISISCPEMPIKNFTFGNVDVRHLKVNFNEFIYRYLDTPANLEYDILDFKATFETQPLLDIMNSVDYPSDVNFGYSDASKSAIKRPVVSINGQLYPMQIEVGERFDTNLSPYRFCISKNLVPKQCKSAKYTLMKVFKDDLFPDRKMILIESTINRFVECISYFKSITI